MKKLKRYLFLPDAHTPYHDRRALEGLILRKVLPNVSFDGIVILGDWFDNYNVSKFTKDPRRVQSLAKELREGFNLLKVIEDHGIKDRVFLEGNHERRLPKMISDKAPELYDIVMEWWETRFKNWTYVPYMTGYCLGKLNLTHDVGRSGEHSTKQSMKDYQDNIVIGHNHLMDYCVRGNSRAIAHLGASFGWLGDNNKVDYRHRMACRRDWVPGFGIGYLREDGIIYVSPKPIIKYSCEIDGVIYQA